MNTLSNVAGTLFTLGTWFVLTPFILHRVGATSYGLWMLVSSLVGYGALLDLGVANAVSKYVAAYRRSGELDRLRGIVSTGLVVFVLAGLIVLLASIALAPFIPGLFKIPAGKESTAQWLVVLSGLGVAVSLPTATTLAVLRGLQRFDLVNIVSAVGTALYTGVIVVILLLGGGVLEITAANTPIQLAMQIPMLAAIRRSAPELKLEIRGASRTLLRTVASFGAAQFVISVSAQARIRGPEAVIGVFSPVARVTSYSLARRLGDLPYVLGDQFVAVLMPMASELHAGHERSRLRAVQVASTRVAIAIFLFGACPIVVLARPFLSAWVGPQYGPDAVLVLILAGAGLAAIAAWPSGAILIGIGRNRVLALFTATSAVLSIGLSVLLVPPLGLTGAALGVLIGTAVESLCLALPYAIRVTGVPARSMVGSALVPALLPALPAVGVLYPLRMWIQPTSLVAVAAVGLLGAAVYAAGYLSLRSTAPERESVRILLSRGVRYARAHLGRARSSTGA